MVPRKEGHGSEAGLDSWCDRHSQNILSIAVRPQAHVGSPAWSEEGGKAVR